MWGTWLLLLSGGLLVVLLLIAIAFGTSGLLFGVLIAAVLILLLAGLYAGRRGTSARTEAEAGSRKPSDAGAPASGEGSAPKPDSSPPPWQAP